MHFWCLDDIFPIGSGAVGGVLERFAVSVGMELFLLKHGDLTATFRYLLPIRQWYDYMYVWHIYVCERLIHEIKEK